MKGALKACGYPNWTFVKTATKSKKDTNATGEEERKNRRNNIVIPYVSGVSEKLRRIFNKHHMPVFFKPSNTLRQTATKSRKGINATGEEEKKNRRNNIVIPYVSGVSEKLRRIFKKTSHAGFLQTKQHTRTETGPPQRPDAKTQEKQPGVRSPMQ